MAFDRERETLVSLFSERVKQSGPQLALYVPAGTRPQALQNDDATIVSDRAAPVAGFEAISWNKLAHDARHVAVALRQLGILPGDHVAQVSGNRYLWIVIDLAVHLARGVHVALHSVLSVEQMAWQIADSGSRLVLGEAGSPWFSTANKQLLADRNIPQVSDDELAAMARGASTSAAIAIEQQAADSVAISDLATILYTSGTTGEPKGVMLTHGNLASNALAALEAFQVRPDDLRLCWLPLSHIYARTSDLYTWVAEGHRMALSASRETIMSDLARLKPTVINGVPYFYEKLMRYLVAQGCADEPGGLLELLGGRMRLCFAGGAALPDHVTEFYQRQGVLLVQGYGLTESSPVISTCSPDAFRIGTVGPPIPGVEVRIADDGEILTRGPHVMLGYWQRPADTAAAIENGWLHTGDLGALEDGFLRITGRKKELLVTSSGKNIAPTLLEGRLTAVPLIAQAMVVGDGRNYLTALIVPDREALTQELNRRGVTLSKSDDRLADPQVNALVSQRVAACLDGLSPWEQVRKIALLARPFTVEADELTPTLKSRRGVILSHFSKEIERLYATEDTEEPACGLEAKNAFRPAKSRSDV